MIDVNQTYCDDHFAIYINIKSLCCMPETNIMLYVNCISIKYLKIFFQKNIYMTTVAFKLGRLIYSPYILSEKYKSTN